MGAAYQSCSEGIEKPKVGLLNIGVEPKKGTSSIREAYQMLASLSDEKMHFLGNVEGRDVFQGKTDVLVTDGFTGNVLLKTAEGVSSFIFDHVQEMMKETSSIALEQPLQNLQRYFSYTEYPGAFICGIEGIVMKCHGNSSARAMLVSIRGAAHLVEKKVISHLKARLTAI
jgi:glycerol-3-phosphate acyltransferase PlsX